MEGNLASSRFLRRPFGRCYPRRSIRTRFASGVDERQHRQPEAGRPVRLLRAGALADARRHGSPQPCRRPVARRGRGARRRGGCAVSRVDQAGRLFRSIRGAARRVRRARAAQVRTLAAPRAGPLDRNALRAAAVRRRHRGDAVPSDCASLAADRARRLAEWNADLARSGPRVAQNRRRAGQRRPRGATAGEDCPRWRRLRARRARTSPRGSAGSPSAGRKADRARARQHRNGGLADPSVRASGQLERAARESPRRLLAGGDRRSSRAFLGPRLSKLPDRFRTDSRARQARPGRALPALRPVLRPRPRPGGRGHLPASAAGARAR